MTRVVSPAAIVYGNAVSSSLAPPSRSREVRQGAGAVHGLSGHPHSGRRERRPSGPIGGSGET